MKNVMHLFVLMMVWCVVAVPAFACAEHHGEAAEKQPVAAERTAALVHADGKVALQAQTERVYPDFASFFPSDSCNGIAYYDFASAMDGPAYYVSEVTQEVLDVCGGACRGPKGGEFCQECPPKGWTCGAPDITPAVKR